MCFLTNRRSVDSSKRAARRAWLALCLLLGVPVIGQAGEDPDVPRPHIVLLIADDLGWNDVGYHGSEIATPAIDRLASEGVRLERFYAAPICAPSRASLLTGKLPIRLGLIRNIRPQDDNGLDLDETILPQVLGTAGYRTALVGKWHLGHARAEQHPNARGFDHFYGHLLSHIHYYDHVRGGKLDWQRNGVAVEEDGYTTRLMAREAVKLLRERDEQEPLFLMVAFNAPHVPLLAAPNRPTTGETREERERSCYTGMVEELDRAVDKILRALETEGIADDTLVLFASDNGGSPAHGADNSPLTGGKCQTLEGGIRVPAVVRWPRAIPGRRSLDQTIVIHDLFPTLSAAAGVDLSGATIDGRNVLPALKSGEPVAREDLFFSVVAAYGHRYALKRDRWKLVQAIHADGSSTERLFDVHADPTERSDLSPKHPELKLELTAALERFKDLHPD